jgi:hypothetical protein
VVSTAGFSEIFTAAQPSCPVFSLVGPACKQWSVDTSIDPGFINGQYIRLSPHKTFHLGKGLRIETCGQVPPPQIDARSPSVFFVQAYGHMAVWPHDRRAVGAQRCCALTSAPLPHRPHLCALTLAPSPPVMPLAWPARGLKRLNSALISSNRLLWHLLFPMLENMPLPPPNRRLAQPAPRTSICLRRAVGP